MKNKYNRRSQCVETAFMESRMILSQHTQLWVVHFIVPNNVSASTELVVII